MNNAAATAADGLLVRDAAIESFITAQLQFAQRLALAPRFAAPKRSATRARRAAAQPAARKGLVGLLALCLLGLAILA
jgi:hypothetical protein